MNLGALPVQPVSDDVFVAPQMTPQAMVEVFQAGFRSVVNNRPDLEGGPEQPTSAQLEVAAVAAGLQYRHLPVSGAYQSHEEAQAMSQLLKDLPRPLLMFCRSGARSARLYSLALGG